MKDYLRLIKFVRSYVGMLLAAMGLMLFSSVLGNGVPLAAAIPLIDRIFSGKELVTRTDLPANLSLLVAKINGLAPLALMNILMAAIILSFLLKAIITYFQQYLMDDLAQRIVRDLRGRLYDKLITLSLDFYSHGNTGKLISRITYDTATITDAVSEGLTDLIYRSFELMISLGMVFIIRYLFSIPWWVVLLVLGIMPTIIYPLIRIGKKLRKLSKTGQERMGDITSALYETFTGIRVVKAFSMEGYERSRFKNFLQQFYRVIMKSKKRINAIGPLAQSVGVICMSVVLWAGGRLVINQGLSPGAFVSFLGALMLCLAPIKRLSRVHAVNQQALAAATRIFEILDTPVRIKESPQAELLPFLQETIVFERVSFQYDKTPVLKDINLTIKRGEAVALVGPTGAGKTTLANLVPRFWDPSEGRVAIDGKDLREVTTSSLRAQIGIVTQETILFNDSAGNNIAYGRKDASVDEIVHAAKVAHAHEFISRLPEGYNTVVGDRGFRLSGGEKQRLALARAVLKNAPVLILDEATSQLDSVSESLIQKALTGLMQQRTVLVIAHRISTVKGADRIVVIEKGRIVAEGRHEELFEKSDLYRRLYELQFR